MREKFVRFMYGRNGMDDLARFESFIIWIPLILSIVIRISLVQLIFSLITIGLIIHMYFRVFSRNIGKRYEENQKYRNFRYNMIIALGKLKRQKEQRAIYKFYKCPMCSQKVRVPKGHGMIVITCPKCREEFKRRS